MKKPIISQKFLDAISNTHAKASALMSSLPTDALALSGYSPNVSNQNISNQKTSGSQSNKPTK